MRFTTLKARRCEVRVFVYKTRRQMLSAAKAVLPPRWKTKFRGCYARHLGYPPDAKHPGILLLNEQDLGSGIVAHEVAHFVVDVFRYRRGERVFSDRRKEEAFAKLSGSANRAFWDWWLNDDDGERFRILQLPGGQYAVELARTVAPRGKK